MLKISRGVELDPEAEPHEESYYRDFDLKNRSIELGATHSQRHALVPARPKVESAVCDHIFDSTKQNRRVAVECVAGGMCFVLKSVPASCAARLLKKRIRSKQFHQQHGEPEHPTLG